MDWTESSIITLLKESLKALQPIFDIFLKQALLRRRPSVFCESGRISHSGFEAPKKL